MNRLAQMFLIFSIASLVLPSTGFTQDSTEWQPGPYDKKPKLAPENAKSPRADFGKNFCINQVGGKNALGKVITEKCARLTIKDRILTITRNSAFPNITENSFVLTLLLEKRSYEGQLIKAECWINEALLELGDDPSNLALINAVLRMDADYRHMLGKKRCERTFDSLPFQ